MQAQQVENDRPVVLFDLALRVPWGPYGYYEQGRDIFYKRVSINSSAALRDEKNVWGEVTSENLSIGNFEDWKHHFEEQGGGQIVPPLPLWVAITEKLYEQRHPALDSLIKDFREEGFSTATTIRYVGSHVAHDFGAEKIRVYCYIPPRSIFDLLHINYDEIKMKEAWRKVFQALLLTADLDRTMNILKEVYGEVSFNVYDERENERARNVPVRIHSRGFNRGFEINGVPSFCSVQDLHRVRGVRLDKLCLVQEVA